MPGPKIIRPSKLHKAVAEKPGPVSTKPTRIEKRRQRKAKARDRNCPARPEGTVVTLVVIKGQWEGSMIVPSGMSGQGETVQKRFEAIASGQFKCVEKLNEKWVATLPAK